MLLAVVGGVLALVLVIAAVTVALVLADGDDGDDDPEPSAGRSTTSAAPGLDRDGAVEAARTALPRIIGYAWQTFDADVAAAKDLMTPDQAERYDGSVAAVRATVLAQQLTVTGTVQDAGLVGIDEDSAKVLLLATQTSSRAGTPAPPTAPSVVVRLTRTGDRWLVADLLVGADQGKDPAEPDPDRRAVLAAAAEQAPGEVWASALADLSGDRATVLVASATTRARLTLERSDDTWRVTATDPVP